MEDSDEVVGERDCFLWGYVWGDDAEEVFWDGGEDLVCLFFLGAEGEAEYLGLGLIFHTSISEVRASTLSPTFSLVASGPASITVPASPEPSTWGCLTSSPPSFWWRSRGVEAVHSTFTRTSSLVGLMVGTWVVSRGPRTDVVITAAWVDIVREGEEEK